MRGMAERVGLKEILAARERLRTTALRTPLIPWSGPSSDRKVFLKLDNLQPTGSFKIRGAGNSFLVATERGPVHGVYTTSAGNMAQALAWHARRLGIPCTTIVPDTAPRVKLDGIRRYGADIVQLSWEGVWDVMTQGSYPPLKEFLYVPPFNSDEMIAGNGTAGLEILEDLPDVSRVYVPFGGGGLITGIAAAIRSQRKEVNVIACEAATTTPFTASLNAGAPVEVRRVPSFVDGIGSRNVLPQMWERLSGLVHESRVVSLEEIADAVRACFQYHHVVVEGAAGAAVAAALHNPAKDGSTVAMVSGGNIDWSKLSLILEGKIPGP